MRLPGERMAGNEAQPPGGAPSKAQMVGRGRGNGHGLGAFGAMPFPVWANLLYPGYL
jgi:hypothetical protein